MKRRSLSLFLLVVFVLGISTQIAFAQFAIPLLVVNTSFLNVRSGDGPEYTVVATVTGGTELPVLGTNSDNTWYLVSTPAGAGWVDVSFTLPRGDFRNVPLIEVKGAAVTVLQTPLTIGLPGSLAAHPFAVTTVATALNATTTATLDVLSVNLRTQPGDNAPVITVLYKDVNAEYPVLGYAYDGVGVRWVSIWVHGRGAGWIEAPKVTVHGSSNAGSLTIGNTTIPVPVVGSAHIVINTSYQNVRSGPGGGFGVIATVPGGTVFYPVGVTNDASWYLVRGDFGQGWVSSEFVLFRGEFSSVPIIQSAY